MSAPKPNADEPAPAMLGGFRLVELLGRGGMGEVYRAEREGPGGYKRRAALKRILPRFQNDKTLRARFVAEARITARLEHPNIVQVLEYGDDPEPYLALEYIDGVTVAQVLKHCADKSSRLPAVAAAYLVSEVATGLDYAHRRKGENGEALDIVHRDVSPQNILVSIEGAVKISDFGIARAADNQHRTAQGISVGKLAYMAPEQAQGNPIDRRADVFALGIILWETLLVRPLIPRNDPTAAISMLLRGGYDPPSRIDPKIPAVFDRIVLEALDVEPARRTPTAGQLAQSLRAFVHSVAPGFDGHELVRILAQLVPDVPWQDDGSVSPWNQRPNANTQLGSPVVAVHGASQPSSLTPPLIPSVTPLLTSPVVSVMTGEGVDAFAAPKSPSFAPTPIPVRPVASAAQPATRAGSPFDQSVPREPPSQDLPPAVFNGLTRPFAPCAPAPPPNSQQGYTPPARAPSINLPGGWAQGAPQPEAPGPSHTGRNVALVLLTVCLTAAVVVAVVLGVVLLSRSAQPDRAAVVAVDAAPSGLRPQSNHRVLLRVPTVPPNVPAVPARPVRPAVPLSPSNSGATGPAVQIAPEFQYATLANGALQRVSSEVHRCIALYPDAAERSVQVDAAFDIASGTARTVSVAFHVAHQGASELRACVQDVVLRRARFAPQPGATGVTHGTNSYRVATTQRRALPVEGPAMFPQRSF